MDVEKGSVNCSCLQLSGGKRTEMLKPMRQARIAGFAPNCFCFSFSEFLCLYFVFYLPVLFSLSLFLSYSLILQSTFLSTSRNFGPEKAFPIIECFRRQSAGENVSHGWPSFATRLFQTTEQIEKSIALSLPYPGIVASS